LGKNSGKRQKTEKELLIRLQALITGIHAALGKTTLKAQKYA